MLYPTLTPATSVSALAALRIRVALGQVKVEQREDWWLVRLPKDRLAFFAATEQGRERLVRERRVLRLLAGKCGFQVPRIMTEGSGGSVSVREAVPGLVDPARIYRKVLRDAEVADEIGRALGEILAEQHQRVIQADVAGWLPGSPDWPRSRGWIRQRLGLLNDDRLIQAADRVLERYEALEIPESDCALVHADIGFHNIALDPDTFAVRGLLDYEGAAWADRHHDFRYLAVFGDTPCPLLDSAISAYKAATGYRLRPGRILLYNAACALTFLADRVGDAPEARPAGRTLAEDLDWVWRAMEDVPLSA